MEKYLSPTGIKEKFQVSRSTAYEILKQFERDGGEVIRIGKLKRVSEELLTEYLKGRGNEKHS